jgi:MFS family permease
MYAESSLPTSASPNSLLPDYWRAAWSRDEVALGTVSFAFCFAVSELIRAFAPRFREAFHLTATQTAFLVAVPVLFGALLRIVTGMLADRFGGRILRRVLSHESLSNARAPSYLLLR